MPFFVAEHAFASGCRLGECPVWNVAEATLSFVDIPAGTIRTWSPTTNREEAPVVLGEAVGSFAPMPDGRLIAATKTGIVIVDPRDQTKTDVARPLADLPQHRFNEGRVDPRGRFLTGHFNEMVRGEPSGALYRVGHDLEVTHLLADITVPNGLAWSPDGRTMYFADTRRHAIYAFDYDLDDGVPSGPRVLVDLTSYAGLPDGAAVDSDGGLWSALFMGGRVVRYTPDGRIDRAVALPVTNVTAVTFGGADLRTLYVTTTRHLLDDAGLAAQPLAGDVFAIPVEVPGTPLPLFRGP